MITSTPIHTSVPYNTHNTIKTPAYVAPIKDDTYKHVSFVSPGEDSNTIHHKHWIEDADDERCQRSVDRQLFCNIKEHITMVIARIFLLLFSWLNLI